MRSVPGWYLYVGGNMIGPSRKPCTAGMRPNNSWSIFSHCSNVPSGKPSFSGVLRPKCANFPEGPDPDPPILAFLEKARAFPQKSKGFWVSAEPLKSLEKRGKTHKKARKIGKRKKQGNRKKQGLEGQGRDISMPREAKIAARQLFSKCCKGGVWSRGCVAFDGFDGFGGFLPAAMTADIGPR